MRIERLDLTRFGGFTDRSIDLGGDGVHVIVGANEAGKTTAMAAIRQLLYGIPPQSPHDYLHSYQDMRIGACLRTDTGDSHEVVRRKRNVAPLRDADDAPIDPTTFARWCHDIDQSVFTSIFSIGHDEIASGGVALLESDGDLGRAVFSVSRGTTDLNTVLRTLEQRAEDLYKRAGQNPRLNAALRIYKERRGRVLELSVNAREVTDIDRDLRDAERIRAEFARKRDELLSRRELLERVKAARPYLAERTEQLARRDGLEAEGRLVDPAVEPVLARAREERRGARERASIAREALIGLDRQLAGDQVDLELLAQREVIADLQSAAGAYRQNVEDLPRRRGALQSAEARLEGLVAQLPAGCTRDADGLPALSAVQLARIEELAAEHPRRDAQLAQADRQVAATLGRLERLRDADSDRGDAPDTRGLEDAVARIRSRGELELLRAEAARDRAAAQQRAAAGLARLGLGDAFAVDGLDAAPVPSLEVIREHRADLDEAARERAGLEQQIVALEDDRAGRIRELDALLRDLRPPSESDLIGARARRDDGWRRIVRAWRDDHDEAAARAWAGDVPIADAFADAVRIADALADRLRQDAGAVARRAGLEQQIAAMDARLVDARSRRERALADSEHREQAWQALWTPVGIAPGRPAAMEGWHEQFRGAVEASVIARERGVAIGALDQAIAAASEELTRLVEQFAPSAPAPTGLAGALEQAERLVRDLRARANRAAEYAAAIADAEEALATERRARAECHGAMERWRAAWADAVASVGLAPEAGPAEARAVLQVLAGIAAQRAVRDDERGRIAGIEGRNAEFAASVAAVIAALPGHADLRDRAPQVAVATLVDRRERAQAVAVTHATLTEARARHAEELDAAQRMARTADARIAEILSDVGLAGEADLDGAIARSRDHADVLGRIADIEVRLRESHAKTVVDLVEESAQLGDQAIASQLDALTAELEEVGARWQDESTRVGALANRRRQITASGDAAEALEFAQMALADVARLAEEYVQIVLARRLLEEQIAAYRAAHQQPLITRANQLFAELTLGRYDRLDTDTGPRGEPVLRARSAAGRVLDVTALSTGTRDQLYLALRLAALEGLIERRGAMPLVLDDLFVHFDDDRTEAGLRVLEDVAQRTQVLLFTHHRSVGEQALAAVAADRVHVLHLVPMTV